MSAHKPNRDGFIDLASRFNVVPVWREVLADLQTPVGAFLRLGAEGDGFLLESVEGGERWGRYSFIGGDAFATVKAFADEIVVEGAVPLPPDPGERPLAYVRRLLAAFEAPVLEGLPPLHGGAVGFIGYDCVRELEPLGDQPPDDLGLPDLALVLTRSFLVFDHLRQRAFAITNVAVGDDPGAQYDEACGLCDRVVQRLEAAVSAPDLDLEERGGSGLSTNVPDDVYEGWVEAAKERILAGDIFQVVPSRRFEADGSGSVIDAYRALRALNPSPYMYLLRFAATDRHPAFEIAGSSPEPLVRVEGDTILTRPIAGTRRRGATPEEDAALAEGLLADPKERAEHVMLVDLARNDVGRVAEYGSVTVDELMIVERYSHVMHIVSSVSGRLRCDLSAFDALTACFPAGTVTGAPKVAAMRIIDELEPARRGPYAGVVGYFDFSGNLDTCITIRTLVATGGRVYVQAGAGVVADSVPSEEAAETRRKAEALLRAVAAASGRPAG